MISRGNFGNYNAMVSLGHWKVPLESVSPRRLRVGLESILSHWAKKTKSERRGILFWGITPPLEIITLFQTSVFISLFGPKRETPVSDWNSLKKNLLHLFLGRNGGTYTRGGGGTGLFLGTKTVILTLWSHWRHLTVAVWPPIKGQTVSSFESVTWHRWSRPLTEEI